MRQTKNTTIMLVMLFSVMFCGAAEAGDESFSGVYHLLFIAPKTMAGPNVFAITGTTAILSATINKDGTGYYLIRTATEAEPVVAEVLAGPSFPMSANVAGSATLTELSPFTAYKLYFVAKSTAGKVQDALQDVAFTTVTGTFTSTLNDTGITWGGSYPSGNTIDCSGEEIGAQDCSHGRDVVSNDDSDGHAGFSFTKLDASGNPLANQAAAYVDTPWACVQDNVSGLIWEVKTTDGGLHDQNDTYSWYNSDPATNGGAVGYPDQGNTCEGYVVDQPSTSCNTQAYTARVNAAGWCGASDWRMPTRKELLAIVSFDRLNPTIDTAYFPNITPYSLVWSGVPYAGDPEGAWIVWFYNGYSGKELRDGSIQMRLVRGGQ